MVYGYKNTIRKNVWLKVAVAYPIKVFIKTETGSEFSHFLCNAIVVC